MVLPTLPSFLELKKVNFNQEHLRSKYASESDRKQQWNDTTKYFQNANILSQQHGTWTSNKAFNNSMNAYTRQQEEQNEKAKEEKRQQLKFRQLKLNDLLKEEKIKQELELKQMRVASGGLMQPTMNLDINNQQFDSNQIYSHLKSRVERIRSAREEDRRKMAEEKLYQHWRQNNPELRQIESKQLNDFVVDQWTEQMREKQEAMKQIENEENEYVKYLEVEKQKAEDLDMELRRLKLNKEIELKEILKQQMIELRQREAESEIIKREESELIQENMDLLRMEEERKRLEQKSVQEEYGRQLLRQHKAKLHKKAKEVQEEIELDLRILKIVNDIQDKQKHVDLIKREQAKADAERMIQVLNQQMRLEKEREAEVDIMFADEAQKEWNKRSQEWERERQARENLMKQVLEERRMQIEEKFKILEQKKLESLEKREELLRDMEKTKDLVIREKEKLERAKLERKQELENQITTRKDEYINQNLVEDVEKYEQEQMEKENYQRFLEMEKQKQVEAKFQPKSFGRKKIPWN